MTDQFSRQSFLGPASGIQLGDAVVAIVGLGGGGSHIVQQCAHLGFRNFVLYDGDKVEESNLNRLIGATLADAVARTPKVDIAERVIRGLIPDASIEKADVRWQDRPAPLRRCDVVFGAVDSFSERDQLEATCRRHLVPLIDIGIDITTVGSEAPVMGGQVILSMPDHPCMRCLGFITEARLGEEATRYGDAGPRPQVVFANGLVASAAVAIAVDLLTDWTRSLRQFVYRELKGNPLLLREHPRTFDKGIPDRCPHYPPSAVGAPVFTVL